MLCDGHFEIRICMDGAGMGRGICARKGSQSHFVQYSLREYSYNQDTIIRFLIVTIISVV